MFAVINTPVDLVMLCTSARFQSPSWSLRVRGINVNGFCADVAARSRVVYVVPLRMLKTCRSKRLQHTTQEVCIYMYTLCVLHSLF